MKIGSFQHKQRFCRNLQQHRVDSDAQGGWPRVDDITRSRLQTVPLWHALQVQKQQTSQFLSQCAKAETDDTLQKAIAYAAKLEQHQAKAISALIQTYEISLASQARPLSSVPGLATVGARDCTQSFLAFGLYQLAKQREYLPIELLERFDGLLNLEAQQCVFWVNWLAYRSAQKQLSQWQLRLASIRQNWLLIRFLLTIDRVELADLEDPALTDTGDFLRTLKRESLLRACMAESHTRFEEVDPELLRPQLTATLAQGLAETLKFWPQRQQPT